MTTSLQVRKIGEMYFNSHPHEEDDGAGSIPAENYQHFNSHPHEEDDVVVMLLAFASQYFNSHPHEEDDTVSHLDMYVHMYFNSHPHEEDDIWSIGGKGHAGISTHILTRRMTTTDHGGN